MKSVNEVSKLSGVSRRTLQYYDEIGLLPPSSVKESGYRQYDDESLRRLWSILFYKEIGISLSGIRSLLENPKEMEKEVLLQHKQILSEKVAQLQNMIHSVDRVLNDEFDISMLRDFDKNRINSIAKAYAKELHVLFENNFFLPLAKSFTALNKESITKKVAFMMNLDLGELITLGNEVYQKFCDAMMDGPDSRAAKEAVELLREFIGILNPNNDIDFHEISQSYLEYKDKIDKKIPGLAEFISAAIEHVYL